MEFANTEIAVVEKVAQEAARNEIHELHELHLALVGGGIGDVIVA